VDTVDDVHRGSRRLMRGMRALACLAFVVLPPFACRRSERRSEPDAIASSSPPSSIANSIVPSAVVQRPSAWSTATFLRDPPVVVPNGVRTIAAHVPEGFESKRIHLVVFFHPAFSCAVQLATSGRVECLPSEIVGGYEFDKSHDDAGTQSILIAPQLEFRGGVSAGKFWMAGYAESFFTEVTREILSPRLPAISLDDVESITLMGHSAGWAPTVAMTIRAKGTPLDAKLKNVVLLDASFAGHFDAYGAWLLAAPGRKFVSVVGTWGDAHGHNAAFVRAMRAQKDLRVVEYPQGALSEAVRDHDVVVARVPADHGAIPHFTIAKVLRGLGLPMRAMPRPKPLWPIPKQPLAPNVDVSAELTGTDGRLEGNAIVEGWTIDLAAGAKVTVTVRGGRSTNEAPCALDTALEVVDSEGNLVAEDDDSGSGFDPRITFVAARAGTYEVRVRSNGPFYRAGPYVIRADVS